MLLTKYSKHDVYNIGKTGLFYRMLPNRSLTTGLHNRQSSTKTVWWLYYVAMLLKQTNWCLLSLPRMLSLGVSASFHQVPMWGMQTTEKPGWPVFCLYVVWLHAFDDRMINTGRKVLLLLENMSSHFPDIELRSVYLHYLPTNTTSHLQPLDTGIIKMFKSWYWRFQFKHFIHKLENNITPLSHADLEFCYSRDCCQLLEA